MISIPFALFPQMVRSIGFSVAMIAMSGVASAQGANTASSSASALDFEIQGSATLANPITTIIETRGSDTLMAISQNGRFMIRGPVLDLWTGETLTTIDGVNRARNTVNLANLDISDEDIDPLYIGTGPKEASLFVDPLCPFCGQLFDRLTAEPAYFEEYTFKVFVVPFLGEQSNRAVTAISCATDRADAIRALLESDERWMVRTANEIEECDPQPIMQRAIMAQMIGVTGVPFLIAPDGAIHRGVPEDLASFLGERG